MSLFSYHLVKMNWASAIRLMFFPITSKKVKGLIHAESMTSMILGSSIFSKTRIFNNEIVIFAQWVDEYSLNEFLNTNKIGKQLGKGWHVRLELIRQWGKISGFLIQPCEKVIENDSPVVAVTIAKMKYSQIPRFLKWGRPVEQQVRDHFGKTLSLASIRYPNMISTFSIWKSQKEMIDMVFGHTKMHEPKRHINAIKERERKEFHFEFTTLRFIPLGEFGEWHNKKNYIPINSDKK